MSFVKSRFIMILCTLVCLLPFNVRAEQKRIALTFDDGPHYKYTEEILDILKKQGVKATFFTVGTNAERFPEIIERELKEGHEVANHTFSHKHMRELKNNELAKEILKCEEQISAHTDHVTKLFRPPEGVLSDDNRQIVEHLGYRAVLWDVDTRDWAHSSVESIVKNVTKNAKDGSVVLFHDFISGNSPTPEALEIIIPKLKELGFTFLTVSEINK